MGCCSLAKRVPRGINQHPACDPADAGRDYVGGIHHYRRLQAGAAAGAETGSLCPFSRLCLLYFLYLLCPS